MYTANWTLLHQTIDSSDVDVYLRVHRPCLERVRCCKELSYKACMFLSQCVEPFSFLASACLHAGVRVCAAHLSVSCGGVRAHTPANLIYSVTIFNRIHLSRVTPNSYHLFWYYLTYMYCNNISIKFNHLFIMLSVACYSGWTITTLLYYYKLTRGHSCKA